MSKAANLPWDVILGRRLSQTYKPRPEAYERACDALGLATANCMMVAAHNEDLLAARNTGMKTAFILRSTEHGAHQKKDLKPELDWDIWLKTFMNWLISWAVKKLFSFWSSRGVDEGIK